MISLALFHPQKPAKAVWEALLWLSERCELEIRFSGGNLRFHFTAVYWSWEYLYDTTMLCKIFEGRVRKLLKRSSGAKIKYSFSRPRVAQYCVLLGWVSLSETPYYRLYSMFWWAKSRNKNCHSDMTWGAGPSLVSLQIYSFCSQLTHFSNASSPFLL